ncbi:MAG: sulfatase [Candidatus Latescibacterota bacterium]|nr:sulfatase [Candidatus Latescibacterota bacterium]
MPNVLFIAVDDLRPQLGCYGVREVHSPHIDELASQGTVFDRAYCQQSVCAPSRASVMTGCRPDTTGIFDLQTPVRSVMPDVVTLPQHFKNHGYTTRSIGKIYHHRNDDLEGWSDVPYQSTGDWQGRGYLTDEAIEKIEKMDQRMIASGSSRRGLGPAFERAEVSDGAYHDGKDADAAIQVLKELKGQSFFLAVGFHKPHLPFNAPAKYWDLYDPEALPRPKTSEAPSDVTPYSLTSFGELRGYADIPQDGPLSEDIARQLVHGYCACVSYMDAQVGRVLEELKRLELDKDTVVMFWGDHGWKLGDHGSWCKHTNFEIDTHAPMILRAPDRELGTHVTGLTEFVDMYPTLCALSEIPVPDHCEGQSLAPLLENPDREWKQAAISQYPRGDVMGYTLRTDSYRYTEWQDRQSGEVKDRELYDHRTSDKESANVARQDSQAGTIGALSEQLAAGWRAQAAVS